MDRGAFLAAFYERFFARAAAAASARFDRAGWQERPVREIIAALVRQRAVRGQPMANSPAAAGRFTAELARAPCAYLELMPTEIET